MRLHLKQVLKKGSVAFATLLLIVSLGFALGLSATQSACGGGENCLSTGENCSQSYLEANDLQGYHCCNGQVCESGLISNILICQY